MTLVVAHRGASRAEPENTLVAFRRAGSMGADGVELDVRRTADDRLVVHHDPVLPDGRTICETPWDALPGTLPQLADALDACEGMFVNIEIKNDGSEPDFDADDGVAHQVAEELHSRGQAVRWLISSFRLGTVDVMRRIVPGVRTAWLVTGLTDDVIATCSEHGHGAVHPWVELLDADAVRRAHGAGLMVNTWTCDDPARLRDLLAWGVDGICTNVPDVALALRAEVASR